MIVRGTYFELVIAFEDEDGTATDITGWTFSASIKGEDGTEVIAATTAGGHFTVTGATDGEMTFKLTDVQTTALTTDLIKFDLLRTDISPGPRWMGRFEIDVMSQGD